MAQDEIVSKLTDMGSFTDSYVADLEHGDKYILNPNRPLPSIDSDYILEFLDDRSISCEPCDEIITPEDEEDKVYTRIWHLYNSKGDTIFKGEECMTLRSCVQAFIEMEEL